MQAKSGGKLVIPQSGSLPVDVDLIRFEKNLLQIGFFGAHDTRSKGGTSRRVEQMVNRNGHKVKVAAEFRGSEALGLPSTTDRDKFVALLKIMSEERTRTGQITNPVRFSGYRLIQELGLARNGEIYEEILRWGRRMTDTTITSEQVVYFAAKKVYSDETLHVFRSFRRTGNSRLDGAERQEHYEVLLEDWLLENLNQRYVIPEDFNAYKQLTRPTAKGIFGNLHLWFHASLGRSVEKDYAELCNLLNVQVYPHLSKIRSTMGLALEELVGIRYVEKWEIAKMVSKQGFKVVLWPGEQILRMLDTTRGERRLSASSTQKSQLPSYGAYGNAQTESQDAHDVLDRRGHPCESLLKRLAHGYGILPATASSLLACYGDQRISLVANYLDELLARPGHRIANPAGLLIHSLQNELEVPTWFVAKKDGDNRQRKASREAQQQVETEFAYVEWLNEQRDRIFAEAFTPEQLEQRLSEVEAAHINKDSKLRHWTKEARTLYIRDRLWRELRVNMQLPSLEEWMVLREGAMQT